MHTVTLFLQPEVYSFYLQIARSSDLPVEQVLEDALFKLAGELALEALREQPPCSDEYFS